MYKKIVSDGYIVSIIKGVSEGNISEQEYESIMQVIKSKPVAPEGYDFRLKEDLSWELYEMELVDEPEIEEEL